MSIPLGQANPKVMLNTALRAIVATWLEEGMAAAGLNHTELARQSKVSRDAIYAILAREQSASDDTLRKLSAAIGRPVPDLTTAGEAPGSPVAPRSAPPAPDIRPTLESLAARLAFLRDQFKAYQQLGQPPSKEVLAEWLRVAAEVKDTDGL